MKPCIHRSTRYPYLLALLPLLLALSAVGLWLGAASAQTVRAYSPRPAPASPQALGIQVMNRTDTVQPGESLSVTLVCSDTWVLVGGGFRVQEQIYNNAWKSAYPRDPHSWFVSMKNQDLNPIHLTSYATCVTNVTDYQIVSSTLTLLPSHANDLHATCPGIKNVLGGGFQSLSNAGNTLWRGSWPSRGNEWSINASNVSTSTNNTIQAYAMCGRTLLVHEIVINSGGSLPAGVSKSLTANCPVGEYVLGGGFLNTYPSYDLQWNSSYASSLTSWTVDVRNPPGSSSYQTPQVEVVCSKLPLFATDYYLPLIKK